MNRYVPCRLRICTDRGRKMRKNCCLETSQPFFCTATLQVLTVWLMPVSTPPLFLLDNTFKVWQHKVSFQLFFLLQLLTSEWGKERLGFVTEDVGPSVRELVSNLTSMESILDLAQQIRDTHYNLQHQKFSYFLCIFPIGSLVDFWNVRARILMYSNITCTWNLYIFFATSFAKQSDWNISTTLNVWQKSYLHLGQWDYRPTS